MLSKVIQMIKGFGYFTVMYTRLQRDCASIYIVETSHLVQLVELAGRNVSFGANG